MTGTNKPMVGTFRSAWRHRRWRRFIAATAVSSTGDLLYSVALVAFLIESTGSAGWVAGAFIARMIAWTVFGPLGGVIADRFERRKLMFVLDITRAVVMTTIALVVAADGPPVLVIALVVTSSSLSTPYRPAAVAATPLLVPEDDLAAANAAEASVSQLAWFVGPALGAAVVALSGPSLAFGVNAATFAFSAVLVAGLGNVGTGEQVTDHEPRVGMATQMLEGARAIRTTPGLVAMTFLLLAVLFAAGVESVVQVVVATERLGMGADGVGVLTACIGAGGLLAVPFSARLGRRPESGQLLVAAGVMMGLPLALLSLTHSPVVAGGLMVVEGLGNIILDVLLITMMQRACPDALLGRVFALQDSGGSLAQLLGTIVAPVLITTVSLEATLWVGGGMCALVAMLLLPSLVALSKRTEAERLRLAPLVDELSALGILGDAGQAALERIARRARLEPVPAGSVVFAEGDHPNDLFVIRSGTVVISTETEGEIRLMGAGEWFGEIGLLREIPRTATVTAADDVQLLAIPGPVFLDAVTAHERIPDPVATALHLRLSRTHPHLLDATTAAPWPAAP